ncbi:MAG TPA: glutamate--tRNA ligase [Saprospiraceae bacterium]|nr:glutamate--tRNA ligase [Saprospiraceae bacterium]
MSVRVRFAPSPTGPLHIGGVRTALYNYLLAKKMGGTFILRIEDTDQTRYVQGAEDYIIESLNWCGLVPDEGPNKQGEYGPYRQSERKDLYHEYAQKLVNDGNAYYAFDTAEELEAMRNEEAENGNHNFKYDSFTRRKMKNSVSLTSDEVKMLLENGTPYTIRLKIPQDTVISFTDLIRGDVSFDSNELDDKVILKADGMPTYHLANIVDDHLMEISHVIRGEEWLSSTAHHVLMYEFFGWQRPEFAHLPLILKPSGQGKLSKRDGAKFGFPVFPLDWHPENDESFEGFREAGFLPEALLNFLAFLGWNPGDDREILSMDELIDAFSIDKIVKSGAKFDYDKAKWYNQQYLIAMSNDDLARLLNDENLNTSDVPFEKLSRIAGMMKERVYFYTDILRDGQYLYEKPASYDTETLAKKWNPINEPFLVQIIEMVNDDGNADELSHAVKNFIADKGLKMGEILPVLRITMTGTMKGPDLFETMTLLGKDECMARYNYLSTNLI